MAFNKVRAEEKPKNNGPDKNRSETTSATTNIDTTVIKFSIKTTGDFVTDEYDYIPFHANMVDIQDLDHNNYILFPDYIKITESQLKRPEMNKNRMKIFTHIKDFITLIKYASSYDRETDNKLLVYDPDEIFEHNLLSDTTTNNIRDIQKKDRLDSNEIITNNIGVIKNTFFPIDGKIYLFGHTFIIKRANYIYKYEKSEKRNKDVHVDSEKQPPLWYDVTIELDILDATNNPNLNDYSSLACANKKLKLKNDIKMLINTQNDAGQYENPLPIINNKLTSITQNRKYGILQSDWEKRNMYLIPPVNENERISRINKMPPLAAKIAVFKNKMAKQDPRNVPPQLWTAEYELLDKKLKILDEWLSKTIKNTGANNSEKWNSDNKIPNSPLQDVIEQYISLNFNIPTEKIKTGMEKIKASKSIYKDTDSKNDGKNYILEGVKKLEKDRINALYTGNNYDVSRVNAKIKELNESRNNKNKTSNIITEEKNNLEYISRQFNLPFSDVEYISKKTPTVPLTIDDIKKIKLDHWIEYRNEFDKIKAKIKEERGRVDIKKTRDDAKTQITEIKDSLNKINILYQQVGATTDNKNPIYGFKLTNNEQREYSNKEPDNSDLRSLKEERDELIKRYSELSLEVNNDNGSRGVIELLNIDKKIVSDIKNGRKSSRDALLTSQAAERRSLSYLGAKNSDKLTEIDKKLKTSEKQYEEVNFLEGALMNKITDMQTNDKYKNKKEKQSYKTIIKEILHDFLVKIGYVNKSKSKGGGMIKKMVKTKKIHSGNNLGGKRTRTNKRAYTMG